MDPAARAGAPVLIFGTRRDALTDAELQAALPTWTVKPERGRWLKRTGAHRLLCEPHALLARPLPEDEAHAELDRALVFLAGECLAEDPSVGGRLTATEQVVCIEPLEGAGAERVEAAARAIAGALGGVISQGGCFTDADGRVLARPWPDELPRPEVVERWRKRRDRSLLLVGSLGFPTPPEELPLTHREQPRTQDEVVRRALALHVTINLAYGMPRELAGAWLAREGLAEALSPLERELLEDGPRDAQALLAVQMQAEALWCLTWALGQVDRLDFGACCGDNLATLLPDLRRQEGAQRFVQAARLRSGLELADALDLAYCLSWGVVDAALADRPSPGAVEPYVPWERRRALEWLMGQDWDAPDMST